MNIINLHTFITVSKTGGFHSAAERLNITQAAVSARIKSLEEQLGQNVFDRGRNGATLTPSGRELLPHAKKINNTWDHIQNMLGTPFSRPVLLRIGAQFSTWEQLLLDWAVWITEYLPETKLELNFDFHSDMLKSIENGKLDMAVTYTSTPSHNLHYLPLPDDSLILVARRPSRLTDKRMPPFIGMDWGPQINKQISRIEAHLPDSKLFIGNGVLGLQHVLENDACGYFPLRAVRSLILKSRLYRVKRAPKFSIPGYIVYNEDHPRRIYIDRAIEGLKGVRAV